MSDENPYRDTDSILLYHHVLEQHRIWPERYRHPRDNYVPMPTYEHNPQEQKESYK